MLAKRLEEVPPSSGFLQHLLDLGEAFWQFAQDYTSYYKPMFGGLLPSSSRMQKVCRER
ncbi:hypothetical protein ACMX2M_30110 [Paenibacillus polymyxa]